MQAAAVVALISERLAQVVLAAAAQVANSLQISTL
jgi:hypothetical protein